MLFFDIFHEDLYFSLIHSVSQHQGYLYRCLFGNMLLVNYEWIFPTFYINLDLVNECEILG